MSELKNERLFPYFVGLAAGGAIFLVDWLGYKTPHDEQMLAAMVSLGGIFAGFLATLKTLLVAMNDDVYRRLKDSGYLNDLILYLKEAIWAALLLCVAAMFGFSDTVDQPLLYSAILFSLLFFSLSALYRVTKVGLNLLSNRETP